MPMSPIIGRRMPIAAAIATVAARLGASHEEAWAAIKSKCFAGMLRLRGIDDKGRWRTVERNWVRYIEPWWKETQEGVVQATVELDDALATPRPAPPGEYSDQPGADGFLAFDQRTAHKHKRSYEADGAEPHSLPPLRLRDVVAYCGQIDTFWPATKPARRGGRKVQKRNRPSRTIPPS